MLHSGFWKEFIIRFYGELFLRLLFREDCHEGNIYQFTTNNHRKECIDMWAIPGIFGLIFLLIGIFYRLSERESPLLQGWDGSEAGYGNLLSIAFRDHKHPEARMWHHNLLSSNRLFIVSLLQL
ncbi:hypothetical protein D1B31_13800 [Neobacillus notoginsengisoli]|uniref:Uncharacterized protein n=1 Tax=Neobacillus notoginsengisoli TaxID=1578198 RepID=A0A417YST0_9BACI|nr:hypothetical protein D1B31_13800 [Neobacillus notoginsengisoli]